MKLKLNLFVEDSYMLVVWVAKIAGYSILHIWNSSWVAQSA